MIQVSANAREALLEMLGSMEPGRAARILIDDYS
jgi:hypothetical protein